MALSSEWVLSVMMSGSDNFRIDSMRSMIKRSMSNIKQKS